MGVNTGACSALGVFILFSYIVSAPGQDSEGQTASILHLLIERAQRRNVAAARTRITLDAPTAKNGPATMCNCNQLQLRPVAIATSRGHHGPQVRPTAL